MNELHRLHIAAIFVSFLTALRSFLIPLVLSFFLGNTNEPAGLFRFEYIWMAILTFVFIQGIGHWLTFRFRISEGELYIQRGIFIKKKRYIQQQKVQSIDITAGFFQRLFGLVKLRIETAGGGAEPEVNLIAISRENAENIRSLLLKKHRNTMEYEKEGSEEQINNTKEETSFTWLLSRRHLLIAALTSSGIGLAISAVAALFSQVEQFLPESIYDLIFGFLGQSGFFLIVTLLFTVVLLSWCISFVGTLLKYGGFKIEKHGEELVISRGLIEKRQLTIHTNRVTAVRIVRNIFRQPFGFSAIYVESAGGGTNEEQLSTVLLPIVRHSDIKTILNELLPSYAVSYSLHSVPKRSRLRFIIRNIVTPLLFIIVIGYFFNPVAYYGFSFIFIFIVFGYLQYKDAGAGYSERLLILRHRKISQTTVISELRKVQAVETRTSFFQEKRSLTSFRFSILSSVIGKSFTVFDLDQTYANKILEWYSKNKKEYVPIEEDNSLKINRKKGY
ncbi:PH domain-containing protein [Halalkalibacter krulwichiae]|uniref:Bacterial membrane flanked domain protein n=1 Tax=Halalkalibacter krulwichiae TaxID=199441 RepID=A0A1X9MIE8_9BACI|nr:PH domain-containing protein [Halalkalibacter krulwichiae]ARK30372.1 Bacterial membrane flanked domain protein [Halalkalibacter krulwichiae]